MWQDRAKTKLVRTLLFPLFAQPGYSLVNIEPVMPERVLDFGVGQWWFDVLELSARGDESRGHLGLAVLALCHRLIPRSCSPRSVSSMPSLGSSSEPYSSCAPSWKYSSSDAWSAASSADRVSACNSGYPTPCLPTTEVKIPDVAMPGHGWICVCKVKMSANLLQQ